VDHAIAQDHDVVYSRYARKHHHWFRNLGSKFNDRVATVLLDKPSDLYLSSFKCLNRFLVGEILKYNGPYPYIDGLILRCTRNIGTVEVRHDPRREGRSSYTFQKLVRLWLNMFVNFSVLPLRLSVLLGFAHGVLGLLMGCAVVFERLTQPETPLGWASVITTILLFSGVQFVMLGLIGEYVGRLFLSSNQTPQFVVREVRAGAGSFSPVESRMNSRAGVPAEPVSQG
jgi:undecaprenyl-phosphate 4-deoxy-4-formamido-L-arabinose transferase